MARSVTYINEQGQRGRVTFTGTRHELTVTAVELGSATLVQSTGEYEVRCECFGLVGCGKTAQDARGQLERIVRAHLQFILDRVGSTRLKAFLQARHWRTVGASVTSVEYESEPVAYAVEVTSKDAA